MKYNHLTIEQYLKKINDDSEKYFSFDENILKVTPELLPFNFSQLFKNDNKILKFEIGFGNGKSLIELAKQNPDINYFGIDRKMDRARKTLSKLENENEKIPNLLISRIGTDYLKDIFRKSSIDEIIMNFPDPWPKKRHHKNRTVNIEFINDLHWLLKDNGVFRFTSDHWEYSLEVMTIFHSTNKFNNLYSPLSYRSSVINRIETQFEEHKKGEGYPIHYLKYQKQK